MQEGYIHAARVYASTKLLREQLFLYVSYIFKDLQHVLNESINWIDARSDAKRNNLYTTSRLSGENLRVQKHLYKDGILNPMWFGKDQPESADEKEFLTYDSVGTGKEHMIENIMNKGKSELHPNFEGYKGDKSYINSFLDYAHQEWERGANIEEPDPEFKFPPCPSKHDMPHTTKESISPEVIAKQKELKSVKRAEAKKKKDEQMLRQLK